MLQVREDIPLELLRVDPHQIQEILSGPTLIHLPGRRKEPLFVSTLLHGNENTGFLALQRMLLEYGDRELPRALSIFIGNVAAARLGRRRLDEQPDYNRIWGLPGDSPEHQMMAQVLEIMARRRAFASVDIHNNTGVNPHYACINHLEVPFLHLAQLFSRTVVYFIRPEGVQSMAFGRICPAVTIECGHVGEKSGIDHAHEFLHACLNLAQIPDTPVSPQDASLFHTVATLTVPSGVSFGFGNEAADILFDTKVDHLNFCELPPGTHLADLKGDPRARLEVIDETGQEVGDRFLSYRDSKIFTKVPVMPSMFTLNREIIRQDCLGYFMERMAIPEKIS